MFRVKSLVRRFASNKLAGEASLEAPTHGGLFWGRWSGSRVSPSTVSWVMDGVTHETESPARGRSSVQHRRGNVSGDNHAPEAPSARPCLDGADDRPAPEP